MIIKRYYLITIAALALLASSGCGTVAPEQFYTLATAPTQVASLNSTFNRDIVIMVSEIPEVINRPELAIFTSQNQLAILDNDRWAEPVKGAINNVLARNIGSALPASWVAKSTLDQKSNPIKVMVRIDAMDARLQDKVRLEASWIINDGDKKPARKGRLALERKVDQNAKPIGIVNAWSDQLSQLSTAIAQDIIQ